MSTVTGVNNDVINAQCSVANPGAEITNAEQTATAQSIVNDLAAIKSSTVDNVGLPSKVPRTGDTGLTGNYTTTGNIQGANVTATGNLTVNGNTTLGNATSDTVTLTGDTTVPAASTFNGLGFMLEKAPAYMADADETLDLAIVNGDGQVAQRLQFLTSPAADRELTLRQAAHADTPPDGFWYEVTVLIGTGPGRIFLIREGATPGDYIARIDVGGTSVETATVRVQKVAGDWRGTSGGYLITKGVDW